MYQQDDRDRREERAEKKLDRLYSFMIRLRLPGGFLTPEQWIATHDIAGKHSTGVIKITTRQTIQLHGIIKSHIRPTLQSFDAIKLDSIAACGDVNRNVVCSSHPKQSAIHEEIFQYADKISTMCLPKTRAFYEIWLDERRLPNAAKKIRFTRIAIYPGNSRSVLPFLQIMISMCIRMTSD
jgi:sulfite reductase (NADPH) hemoprotein beta-component